MDKDTKEIISRIASIQVEAISSIDKEEDVDPELAKLYLQIDKEKWEEAVEKHLDIYKQMIKVPTLIRLLNEYQLLICSHILYKMEMDWIDGHLAGIYGAWEEIHKAMLKFHPEFTLSRV